MDAAGEAVEMYSGVDVCADEAQYDDHASRNRAHVWLMGVQGSTKLRDGKYRSHPHGGYSPGGAEPCRHQQLSHGG
jgi:hypothetical protein